MRPIVAIVGRPNVGKSTLLNRLAGRHAAVVDDVPGVTRDPVVVETELGGHPILLVDTGGLEANSTDNLAHLSLLHAKQAIEDADAILWLCDGQTGLHPSDGDVANLLRRSNKPVVCIINKCDPGARDREVWEFHRLGFEPYPISALHGTGVEDVVVRLAEILVALPSKQHIETVPVSQRGTRLCLLGRPNVGKSSIANRLLGKERQIVSEQPGTTRDAVDLVLERQGQRQILIDTPGVRRKRSIERPLERYSVLAALRSLERADIAIVVIDGAEQFSDQDARLLHLVEQRGRGLIIIVNKIDVWPSREHGKQYMTVLHHGVRFVSHAPILLVSAKKSKGIDDIIPTTIRVAESCSRRIGTSELNRFAAETLERQPPPLVKGRRAKILFITQSDIRPPTFVAMVNDPERIPQTYRRFIENQLRLRFDFAGANLRWVFRRREHGKPVGHKRSFSTKRRPA